MPNRSYWLVLFVLLSQASAQPPALQTPPPVGDTNAAEAAAPAPPQRIEFADGQLAIVVPGDWKKIEPRNRIIEHEFSIAPPAVDPPADGVPVTPAAAEIEPGRMTITLSGGSIEDNMQRWMGQFRLGHDDDGEDAIQRSMKEIGPLKVHRVDIKGTYFDTPQGPLGPKVEHANYRLLGAMIETPDAGTWYLKFYGHEGLIETQVKAFDKMLESLEVIETKE